MLATLAAAAFGVSGAAQAGGASLEYAVKAAFIYKFPLYVAWPNGTNAPPDSPMSICVVGNDDVSPLIQQMASGQHIGAHPVTVRALQMVPHDTSCNILYVADADPNAVANDLAAVKGMPVLTITDADRSPAAAGIISFIVRDNHVRFNVDDATAAEDGLVISSNLLGLANSVKRKA